MGLMGGLANGLTAEQRAVVDHEGAVRVVGDAGTGKTTALLHRYLALVERHGASRVAVVASSRVNARGFVDAALPHLRGGFDALPVTTIWGLAFDLVSRGGQPLRLLTSRERAALITSLLAAEAGDAERWPTLHGLVGRRALAGEVAAGLAKLDELEQATAAGVGDRWTELLAFADRYRAALAERNSIDAPGLVRRAADMAADADAGARRFDHLLVDDFEAATPAVQRLIRGLASSGVIVTVAGNFSESTASATPNLRLTQPFRRPQSGQVAVCRHPSIEPEVVAAALLAAHDDGVPWGDMAVLLRYTSAANSAARSSSIVRSLARHGIPVAAPAPDAATDPTVRGLVDLLRWVAGDAAAFERVVASPAAGIDPAELRQLRREARAQEIPLEGHPRLAALAGLAQELRAAAARSDPAFLAHLAFRRTLSLLVPHPGRPARLGDERALDAVVAFLDGLNHYVDRHPGARLADFLATIEPGALDGSGPEADPWRSARAPLADAVTVTSIDAAAGREWHTVVVSGCVEGELPAIRGRTGFFDPELLDGPPAPVAERRRRSLAEERRLFGVARTRATAMFLATAAPEPGVPVSRFVVDWPTRSIEPPRRPAPPPSLLAPTAGTVPVWPTGSLELSATKLETYADCPLRFAYSYALGLRGEAGVHAGLGTIVHEVLDQFLDPRNAEERTWERLVAIAQEQWRDDIARYRPQLEEARRDLFDMLQLWWETEGQPGPLAPDVLRTEHGFEIEVGPHRVKGKIDRVDRADDGRGIRVLDYKTGKQVPKAVDVAENLQLATYYLAARRDPELAALGIPTQLRLLFVREMKALDQAITPDHMAATEARILDAAARILAEDFEPSVEASCRNCDFHRLCPLQLEGREVGTA